MTYICKLQPKTKKTKKNYFYRPRFFLFICLIIGNGCTVFLIVFFFQSETGTKKSFSQKKSKRRKSYLEIHITFFPFLFCFAAVFRFCRIIEILTNMEIWIYRKNGILSNQQKQTEKTDWNCQHFYYYSRKWKIS